MSEEEKTKEVAKKTWDSWLNDLEEKEQPNCNIENPEDCENCGS
tara:strand:+ start:4050 stop:4181 length:132 start_codon:yes stop_codon:yes gene_type:complete